MAWKGAHKARNEYETGKLEASMENIAFQERVKRLKEVNDVIKDLDPAIREAALPLLAEYVTGQRIAPAATGQRLDNGGGGSSAAEGATEFFVKFPEGKPSDNVICIAAYLYSQYGAEAFKLDEIHATA